ncbi:crotonobetainyl-CoA:carnitine CoA-transferase CaiB-like acyl-CoA transferase [Streptomyces sp. V4I23]|uniref:CaiB/BaiF CoA transferase family protein n=1 Tax=Streptomyces sp. V4I23 TaxID=3042282 RepID=UPI0027856C40|nr:CoA transferase [Streptomyces sp. V4I23]MDQ1012133.1 crotonobetainyl-CoA:carnitine CoA-transferase CaiB-like acyl-CoA transferase [Streptomyces sp. V4I23]
MSTKTHTHADADADSMGPLDGVVVVDLSRALAGPQTAMMLGDMGARVIKVEAPGTGDESRSWGPPFVGPDTARESTYFLSCNRNKESVTADLKSPNGIDLLTRLVRHGDVLVENFRPGVMDRLGFSAERLHEINPRLVILSISGFGHDGPQGGRAGYDQIAQGEAGLMSLSGPDPESPTRMGVPIGDVLAGMNGAYGVVSALYEREHTGRGKVVRTSLLASIVGVHAYQGTRYTVAGEVGRAAGNHHVAIAPYGLFRCDGGAIQVAVATDAQWAKFAEIVGLDTEDPRYVSNAARVAHRDDLVRDIEKTLLQQGAAHWLSLLDATGIPCGEVRTLDQVYACPQTRSQGLVIEVNHPSLGAIELPGPAVRFDDGGRRRHTAPPRLGEHNESVRTWLNERDG